GIAMQHARMYGEAVHRAARLRDLVAVSQSITGSLDSADVMRRITQAVAGMRPGALGAVHLYDAARGVLRAEALSGAEWQGLPIERPRNASLCQTERGQAERIRALATVNQRLSSALELDELLRTISESAASLVGVRFVAFWLADEAARTLTLASSSDPAIAGDSPRRTA